MAPIDSSIEQADARCVLRIWCDLQPRKQIIHPELLLSSTHADEKIGGLLGTAQFGNTVQDHHGLCELLLRSKHHDNGSLGKIDDSVANRTLRQRCELLEIVD